MKLTHVRRDSQDMARDFRDRTFVDAKKSLNHEIDKLVRTGRPEQQTVSDLKVLLQIRNDFLQSCATFSVCSDRACRLRASLQAVSERVGSGDSVGEDQAASRRRGE